MDGVELDYKFVEKLSGKNTERPELRRMLTYVRQGDKPIVYSLDRLARNLADLLSLVKQLNDKGVEVHFLKENLVFSGNNTPMSMLMLSMLRTFAEFERALIKERQREGIEIAKKKGTETIAHQVTSRRTSPTCGGWRSEITPRNVNPLSFRTVIYKYIIAPCEPSRPISV